MNSVIVIDDKAYSVEPKALPHRSLAIRCTNNGRSECFGPRDTSASPHLPYNLAAPSFLAETSIVNRVQSPARARCSMNFISDEPTPLPEWQVR